ncbi:MAG: alkaline phosphatase family protein [Fimbriimonadaceae bacterium]|nr:alkaline phosphatase family protein [Fimbriimonadaceae bacterium]
MKHPTPLAIIAIASVAAVCVLALQAQSVRKVRSDSRTAVVPTGDTLRPDGTVIEFDGRTLGLATDGQRTFVRTTDGFRELLPNRTAVGPLIKVAGGAGLTGFLLRDNRLYLTTSGSDVLVYDVSAAPKPQLRVSLPGKDVKGASYPAGLALDASGKRLYVALNRDNSIAEVDLDAGKELRRMRTSPAPFGVALSGNDRLVVTTWGVTPTATERQAKSSGTAVRVAKNGAATGGVVEVHSLDPARNAVLRQTIGMQATELTPDGDGFLFATSANDAIYRYVPARNELNLLRKFAVGSAPTDVRRLRDGRIAVALGSANAIRILAKAPSQDVVLRSAWYPLAVRVALNSDDLIIASAKGFGSRAQNRGNRTTYGVYDFHSVISVANVQQASRAPVVATALPKPRKDQPARPVPERIGEPSPIEHVFYVLKENRTYDQVFGDLPQGDGDKSLAIYGERVTPNHHALAREYVLLDNYYCNGVLSADGHSWSTEGNVTTYFERAFGGWTRSYPFGDDPIAISPTGHIWDRVLDAGKTFRNFGEYNYSEPANRESHTTLMKQALAGNITAKFRPKIEVQRLREHSNLEYPGWNMNIPEIVRAEIFLREFRTWEKARRAPNLSFIYLPQDHTSGTGAGVPTPEAHMADNDLALGRIVEAISKSPFWKKSVIFVIEDDPQDGFDHVDGHRSICLVIGPHVRRGAVVHQFYNQTSVLRTIGHVLGLAPMSHYDRISPLMNDCFSATPNFATYRARPSNIDLLAVVPAKKATSALNLSKPDMLNEDMFNRQLWSAARPDVPYPAKMAGAHGRGLAGKGLTHAAIRGEAEDED